ncbi:hypothetical protein SAMN02927903_03119 [Flavobacterium caeni]|uniref:Uncharacterized protein n=1 Tax=Flavobacterium caeni TaxID=490189 RepID=A0A1G5K707_9FLAO|nr:hypothetical protein SAMN02927903_03119 [Flavobacterium caeni]
MRNRNHLIRHSPTTTRSALKPVGKKVPPKKKCRTVYSMKKEKSPLRHSPTTAQSAMKPVGKKKKKCRNDCLMKSQILLLRHSLTTLRSRLNAVSKKVPQEKKKRLSNTSGKFSRAQRKSHRIQKRPQPFRPYRMCSHTSSNKLFQKSKPISFSIISKASAGLLAVKHQWPIGRPLPETGC